MKDMWSSTKTPINRRSFVKNGLTAAGVATAGVGLMARGPSALAEVGLGESSGRLTRSMLLYFGSRQQRRYWKRTSGYSTTNSLGFKIVKNQVAVGIRPTRPHFRCWTPTWRSTSMTTLRMNSPTRTF